jgi:hypothetical protein
MTEANRHSAWSALRHSGNLLAPTALASLPEPSWQVWGLSDRLRSALVAFDPAEPSAATFANLLDVVLEQVCGLANDWRKGAGLGAADAEKLLDGTVLRPRRIWAGPTHETLAVFTTTGSRLGVGRGRRPVAHVIEYLRRRGLPLGLLTNGSQWRLIWADADSQAWVEWEAERWLEADQLSPELTVLRQVLAPTALERAEGQASPLLTAIRDTRRGQGKLSSELGERVRRAVETLLRSRQGVLTATWSDHQGSDLYVAACHFVMRLVVTLFAEARELLPVDNPIYHQAYGLRSLLDQLDRLTPERRRARFMAWPRLLALFRLLHQGSPHPAITLPAYGGDLFRPGDPEGDGSQRALALLEGIAEPPDDHTLHTLLVLLTRTTQRVREGSGWRTVAAPVDFTELTSEYIGILYEGLLDYELHRAGQEPVLFLNLGDQPALPLDRLEAMDDQALRALVEKAKVKKQAAPTEEAGEDDEGEEQDQEDQDSADTADDEAEASGEEPGTTDPASPGEPDAVEDARAEAQARAEVWSRRAARVGKLVSKPRGKTAASTAAYDSQLDAAARQLIADLKLPGELYLVRWGGTRKGAGTFYTRPQLTLPTVRRTLEPLIYDGGIVRPPEALLALKVCDPAMGSGSFLVAALRVLTAAVIAALYHHQRIIRTNGRTTIACELLPEADRSQPTEGFEERLEAIVRRAVVEHCLYGVDKDQLAVELGRVALWVETLDKNLPFTFLDHKLRCGNALVGTWLDRFRDYPLLAFDRESPDSKYSGVHHPEKVWHQALKETRQEAIRQQVEILQGQLRVSGTTTSDEELRAAVERVRRLYRDLRAVPAGRPDERARIWRERIQSDAALKRVREAFDTWCALWFWPLDQLDALPLPSALPAPTEAAREVVRSVAEGHRFFHWELEFPDVFTEEHAGFDAIVGNPPWEIQKPSSKEFFSNVDPLYRAYGKQEALQAQRRLFEADPAFELEWLAYLGDFKNRGNFVRHAAEPFGDAKVANHEGGDVSLARGDEGAQLHKLWRSKRGRYRGTSDPAHPFRFQGSGDLNSYKMFLEAGHALLRPGGQLGLVVPSGLYTDKGTGALRRLLLERCTWRWLYGFENRNKLFDIHRSFKFCVTIAEKGGHTKAIEAAFMRHDLEDWAEAKGALAYPAERVSAFSPKSLSILEIRSERDLEVLTKLYANGVLLGDDGPDGWGINYATEFHMTNDSKLFIARDKAEAMGFRPDLYGRWVDEAGEVLLPLYEGRMIGQFDFSQKGWVSGKGRSAVWREIPWNDKRIEPQFLMRAHDFALARPEAHRDNRVAFMDVSAATNMRTCIAAMLPPVPCGNSAPILHTHRDGPSLTAALCSWPYDYVARQRCGGLHLNYFVIEETPLPRPERVPGISSTMAALIGTHPSLARIVMGIGGGHARAALTTHERLRRRSLLEAVIAALYGLDRDDFAWILKDCDHPTADLGSKAFCRGLDPKGFWRVDKDQDPELRHTVLSLAAFDDLTAAIAPAAGDTPTERRDAGIQAFCDQNDGDGWMLPETLCLADLGLTRSVNVGVYDDRARTPQPVRSRLGPRFLDWQLAQTPEESWAECERHARAILEGAPAAAAASTRKQPSPPRDQYSLFDEPE